MLLVGVFIAALARSLASPVFIETPSNPIPSPLCVVTAVISAGQCDTNKRRTIFDILYSCLSVIFLCTYTAIHHNIPDQNDSKAKKIWLKFRTMLYAMVAPEVVIMWALKQRIMASVIVQEQKERGWTRTHAFFVQMGGLMLKEDDGTYRVVGRWSNWDTLQIPAIREKEITDRGKGDPLAKSIVVLQTTWFVVQCIARRIEGLVLTELELVTLAFAALNVVTYILWWDKPLNVEYPIYFDREGNQVDGPEERIRKDGAGKEELAWYSKLSQSVRMAWGCGESSVAFLEHIKRDALEMVWESLIKRPFTLVFGPLLEIVSTEMNPRLTSVHPFYAGYLGEDQLGFAYLCASAIGTVFGGIHLIGWNFPFWTVAELWLWRASSLVLTVVPAIMATSRPLKVNWWRAPNEYTPLSDRLFWLLAIGIGSPLYTAARIVIIFLAFFTLRDLPESAYKNIKWSNFIPHI